MIKKQIFLILLICLTLLSLLPLSVFASIHSQKMSSIDNAAFNQALALMHESKWHLAQSLLNTLHMQYPSNKIIKNNLAVVLLNVGQLKESQLLFVSIIEQDQLSATAYQNLKKLYSYSAAKTYSEGLSLMRPVDIPELITITSNGVGNKGANSKGSDKEEAKNKKVATIVKQKSSEATLPKAVSVKSNASEKIAPEKPVKIKLADRNVDKSKKLNSKGNVSNKKISHQQTNKDKTKLLEQLEKWKNAWSEGNSAVYIAIYKANYAPQGRSRASWLKNRHHRITKDKKISVSISESKVYINESKKKANILFTQGYQSKGFSDQVIKRLYWIKKKGEWYIEKESIIKVL